MKLGIATSVLVNYSIQDAITAVAEAGYDGIDIWGGRPHVYRRDYGRRELANLRKRLDDLGLTPASFMPAFFRYPFSLSSPHDTIRRDSIDYMRECADNAAALGAAILLVVPSRSLHGQARNDAYDRLVDSIHAVCEYCEQYQLRMGLEHANEGVTDLVVTHRDAVGIIGQVGHPSLGVVLDTGHLNLNREDPCDAIHELGPLLLQFHLDDNDGQQQQNLIPGEGTFDFRGLLQPLGDIRFEGFVSLELGWQYSREPERAVREAAVRVRELLQLR